MNEIYQKGSTFRIMGIPYARFNSWAEAHNYLKPKPETVEIECKSAEEILVTSPSTPTETF